MYDKRYTYEFLGDPRYGQAIPTTPQPGQVPTTPDLTAGQEAAQGFGARIGNAAISRALISPLNQATGGLAAPAYNLGKSILTGAGAAAVGSGGAMLVVAGIMFGVRKISERVDKLESEAAAANEREVLLLRAGRVAQVSTYESNFFTGVQKVNRG